MNTTANWRDMRRQLHKLFDLIRFLETAFRQLQAVQQSKRRNIRTNLSAIIDQNG